MGIPNYENAIDIAKTKYGTINSIFITGGGFIHREFKGIGTNSQYGWQELVWKKPPSRGQIFAFTNIDDIAVGLVARCEVNIKYMDIQDFIDLRKIVGRERHFLVEFFDIDSCEWVIRDMYCTENSSKQLFALDQKLIGKLDLTLKFAGTNLDLETVLDANGEHLYMKTVTVTYNLNGGTTSSKTTLSHEYSKQVKLYSDEITPPWGHLAKWVTYDTDGNIKEEYLPGQSITLLKNLNLYAIYE